VDIPNSRGTANYVEKCSFCGKQNTISKWLFVQNPKNCLLDILTDSFKSYSESDEFKEIVKFECRGTEPVDFQPTGEWKCSSSLSDTKFVKIDLSEVGFYMNRLILLFRRLPTMMRKHRSQ
jgi:hypothetical protein